MTKDEAQIVIGNIPLKPEVLDDCYSITEYQEAKAMAIEALGQEPRWIPVSERLPNNNEYIKNNGLFIVSDGNRSYFEWFDIYDKWRFGEPTMIGFRVDYAITAWMPLPEPYKADSEVTDA